MIKKIIIALLFLPVISSCKNSNSAFNYSEAITKKDKDLTVDVMETEKKVGKYADANQYDSIAIAGKAMEQKVETVIKEIKEMKMPKAKEVDNFKTAALGYFEFIKSLYTAYKNYGLAQTDTEREKLREQISEISNKASDAANDIQSAQKKFADANGFKIEKK